MLTALDQEKARHALAGLVWGILGLVTWAAAFGVAVWTVWLTYEVMSGQRPFDGGRFLRNVAGFWLLLAASAVAHWHLHRSARALKRLDHALCTPDRCTQQDTPEE